MAKKPTYEELEQRVRVLEEETTKCKLAEDALRESEEKLVGVIRATVDPMTMIDEEYNIVWANDVAKQVLDPNLLGKKCHALFHTRDIPCEQCGVKKSFADGNVHRYLMDVIGTEGERKTFWCTASVAEYYEVGRPKLVVEISRDITKHKRDEEALKRSGEELRRLSYQLLDAQEQERKRIGSELHDGIAQSLSAIKMGAELALIQFGKKDAAVAVKVLESIVPMVERAVEEVRRISRNLRPSILDNLGILATISWLCKEFKNVYSGIDIEEQIDIQEEDVPDSLKIIIFRILQEALNNIARHSRTELVRLSLIGTDGKIELTIADDGVGFDVEHVLYGNLSERGLGIASMKERAELSAGSFKIESGKGEGTTVRVLWAMP